MRNKIIRKLSVGSNYPDGSIHYTLGKEFKLNKKKYVVADICMDTQLFEIGKLAYNIYISNGTDQVLWKTICDMPVAIEYKIDFE